MSESLMVQFIKHRVTERNKNFMAVVTGATGSGKSWGGLTLCDAIDPNFSEENIVFWAKDFLGLLTGERKQLTSGSAILWDEIQIDLNSKSHMSILNRLINSVLQTFRHKNLVVIMTTPHFGFIDKGARALIHCHMRTSRIDPQKEKCIIKPNMLHIDQLTGEITHKAPRWNGNQITQINVSKPRESLVDLYEFRKNEFTSQLNARIERDILRLDNKHKKPEPSESPPIPLPTVPSLKPRLVRPPALYEI